MQKIRSFFREIPSLSFLLFFLLILLPIEHKYDRPLRPFFYHFTDIPRDTVKSLYFYISDLVVLFCSLFFLFQKRGKILPYLLQKNAKFLFGVILLAFLSLVTVKTSINITHWMKVFYFSLSILLYVSILSLFRSRGAKSFFILLFCGVLVVSVFECSVGISQYFRQKSVGLRLLSEPKLESPQTNKVTIYVQDGTLWLPDRFLKTNTDKHELLRAYGTFPHPNVLGGFLVFALFATYALFILSRSKGMRFLLALAVFLQIFTLFITFSRSALFAWMIGSFVWLISFVALKKEKRPPKELFFRIISLSSLCALSFVLCIILFYSQIRDRGGVVSYTPTAQVSDQDRIVAQVDAWEVIQKYPLLGVGYGNYQKGAEFLFQRPCKAVHSIYFLVAAEMGLVAFALFMIFLGQSLMSGWQKRGDPLYTSIFAAFVGFLFIGACDYYPLFFQQTRLLFLALAAFLILEERESEAIARMEAT